MPQFGKSNVDWQQRVDFNRLREYRMGRAHKMLHKYGIGAAIIFNWDSGRYLSRPWLHPYGKHLASHYCLLVRDAGFPYMPFMAGLDDAAIGDVPWLEGRLASADVLAQPGVIKLRPDADSTKLWKTVAQQIKSLMKEHNVAGLPVSIDYGPPPLTKALQDEGLTVVDGNPWILEADMVKSDDEIELMKMAACCNEAGYSLFAKEFRPGMRENQAQGLMAKGAYDEGAEYIEGWVLNSGPRSSPRNFNWSDRTVRPGELLSLEACHVTYCGYKVCYDRTFLVGGKPTEIQSAIYNATVDLQHKVQELLKPGITNHDVARLRPFPQKTPRSLEELRKIHGEFMGTGFNNHFGGMGIRWDDAPVCNLSAPEITLEKNMIVAYHAIYRVEGGEGVATENSYRITDTGCELLCKWPYEDLMVVGN